MAYEFRRPIFNFAGVLSAAASPTDTTLSSTAFASLPSDYTTGLYLPLVLADDAAGKAEIVWVVGHTAGSSSVTVVRGREGSTPQSFQASNVVRGSATTWDLGPVVVPNRAALPAAPYAGMRALILDEGIVAEYSSTTGTWTGDPKRRHRWQTTNAGVGHDLDYTPFGLALVGSGAIASINAGVVTLNKPGRWFLSWQHYSDHNASGWVWLWFAWTNGAMLEFVEQRVHRAATGFAGSGALNPRIEWEGYVSPAQAAAPLTPMIRQRNSAGTALAGTTGNLVAEYLGAA